MDDTIKTLQGNFEVLPPDVQNVIVDQLTRDKIISIGTRYNLTPDQKFALENEIFFVLLGVEVLSRFRANVVNQVGISYDQTIKISFDVNKEIFDPVIGLLKEMEEEIRSVSSEVEQSNEGQNREVATSPAPDHLLPSHEMIREPHLHSQTLMPKEDTKAGDAKVSRPTFIAKLATPEPVIPKFSSIVDQKLSKLVRTERGEASVKSEVEEKRKTAYTGGDPYREPAK